MSEVTTAPGRVVAVNVGRPRKVASGERRVTTSIWKEPVTGRVHAGGVNLVGDEQADQEAHGGRDKAVYAYALEDYQWWSAELGVPVESGSVGENLTLAGVDVTNAVIGERWAIGSAVFEVCQPRTPCFKLGLRMGDPGFPRRFTAARRPGAYVRICAEGDVGADDEVRVVHRPDQGVTVVDVFRARANDPVMLGRLLAVPELADGWLTWAIERALKEVRRNPLDHELRVALRTRLLELGLELSDIDAGMEGAGEG